MSDIRIGLGYDVHAFADGCELVLGGVRIASERGLAGHSDADVLVHALMDAILGAMRAGDIGKLFPDTDPAFKDVSSLALLADVCELAADRGFALLDADCVVALEEPKVSPYREAMRVAISGAAGVDVDHIGIKATTTEGLGLTGRGEGVAAWAVALMEKSG
jgi:2-C-methyl-D-erythritol 2,4-cyclodiphosphate synthase